MSVRSMLEDLKMRAFSSDYDEYIHAEYTKWSEENYKDEECEYAKAMCSLPAVLSDEQMDKLKMMESNYQQNCEYAARYGFDAGIYSGFNQFFAGTDASENGLESTLMKNLMEMPGMMRHIAFHERNSANLKLGEALDAELTEENQEHLVSVECAWGQRIHSAACHAFYCGYRAALQIIDTIHPLDSTAMIQNTLLLEYRLGYINSYEQLEQHRRKTA